MIWYRLSSASTRKGLSPLPPWGLVLVFAKCLRCSTIKKARNCARCVAWMHLEDVTLREVSRCHKRETLCDAACTRVPCAVPVLELHGQEGGGGGGPVSVRETKNLTDDGRAHGTV